MDIDLLIDGKPASGQGAAEEVLNPATGETLVSLENLALIVGSGGVLSHAPRRAQAALMMIERSGSRCFDNGVGSAIRIASARRISL